MLWLDKSTRFASSLLPFVGSFFRGPLCLFLLLLFDLSSRSLYKLQMPHSASNQLLSSIQRANGLDEVVGFLDGGFFGLDDKWRGCSEVALLLGDSAFAFGLEFQVALGHSAEEMRRKKKASALGIEPAGAVSRRWMDCMVCQSR